MPVVPASDWVKAQKLSEDGVFKCTFRLKGSYIVPSSHLLRNLPSTCKTPEAKKQYISVSRLPRLNPDPNRPRRQYLLVASSPRRLVASSPRRLVA